MNIRKNVIFILLVSFVFIGVYSTVYSQSSDTLSNGLVGYWKFDSIDSTNLTTPDASGAGNTGSIGTNSSFVSGVSGQALRMDVGGSQQYMTTKNTFSSSQWSVSTWINPDIPISTNSPYLGNITFFSADMSAAGTAQMLLVSKDGVRTYQTKIGDYSFESNPGWHHVVVTYNGTTLSAYVDGVFRGSIPYGNILANNIKRYIGTNTTGSKGHVFVGAIDETRIYNRSLSSTEISTLFSNKENTPVVAPTPTTPSADPVFAAPVSNPKPNSKITSNLTVSSDKKIYKLGDTVKMSATFTLDSDWVTYLKSIGDKQAEVFFDVYDPTNKFIVQSSIAFDLVNTSVTKTYDWNIPTNNNALAGKDFSINISVRDASGTATETKSVTGLSIEALPVTPLVSSVTNISNDGATVIEANVPAGTSPDIFAGVLASQDLLPNQFTIESKYTKNLNTTNALATFPISFTKTGRSSDRAEFRLTALRDLNLTAFNAIDIIAENTSNVPVKLIVQVNENDVFSRGYQGYYIMPANSGARHILIPIDKKLNTCNEINGTDDCPMSPRQAVVSQLYTNGTPDNSKIGMIRTYIDDMPQGAEYRVYSMKVMNISYAPQYLKNYIDKYGQNNWVDFPEKVTSDAQLKADAQSERTTLRPLPSIWDEYGGDKTATGYGTGKFKTIYTDGKWWLVNPLGNLMYLTAVTQVDYTLTPGYIGGRNASFLSLDRSGLFNNAYIDNRACHGKGPWFCGGTSWSAYTSNIIRKYAGPNSTFTEVTDRWRLNQQNRLREWGFNSETDRFAESLGGWKTGVRNLPFITQFNLKGKTSFQKVKGMDRVVDPFDPAFEAEVNRIMSGYFNTFYPNTSMRVKDDPLAIGTAAENEIPWGLGTDSDPKNVYNVIVRVLEQDSSQYSKVAFTNLLKEKYNNNFQSLKNAWGSALSSSINSWDSFQNNSVVINGSVTENVRLDLSFLMRKFADKYLTVTKNAIKAHGGQDHLFAGVRFAGFYRTPREVIDSCAEICDIITINYYNYTTANEKSNWDYLLAKNKPVLITEFYFDSPSRGSASASRTQNADDSAQGDAYEAYARDVLSKPQIIGYSYHDIYDQPLLGSIWSENNLTGFVSETDRIYPELVNAAKRVNLDVYRIRGSRPNGNVVSKYSVTTNKSGDGTISGSGISCGNTCKLDLDPGTSVTLTATPNTGSTFAGWSGDCTGNGSCTLNNINGNKTVSANFVVTDVNTAPVARDITVNIVSPATSASITLNAVDAQNDSLTYNTGVSPLRGDIVRTGEGKYTYTIKSPIPSTDFVDGFNYNANDGRLTGNAARVTINYTAAKVSAPSQPSQPAPSTPSTPSNPNTPKDSDGDGVLDANDLCPDTPVLYRSEVNAHGCIKPKASAFDIKPNFEASIRNFIDLEIGKINIAKIRYLDPVDLYRDSGQLDIDSNVIITDKKVQIKSSNIPELNKPAVITFYGVTEKNPKILRDGVECKPPQCVITSNRNGVVTVNVNSFSTYELVEGDSSNNNIPVVSNSSATVPEGSNTVNITLNATDSDGDSLFYTVDPSLLNYGSVVLSGNVVTYTFDGPDRLSDYSDIFKFSVSDGQSVSGDATVTVNITKESRNVFERVVDVIRNVTSRRSGGGGSVRTATSNSNQSIEVITSSAVPSVPVPNTAGSIKTKVLTYGSRGEEVRALQKMLNASGFKVATVGAGSPGKETPNFGPATRNALIKYQLAKSLPATGTYVATVSGVSVPVSTGNTVSTSGVTFQRDLRLGSSGADVKKLQQILNQKGFTVATKGAGSPGNETTYFGPATKAALMKFQPTKGIKPVGYVGTVTRRILNNL